MKPNEHKTVQARILAYAQEIGWSFVSREVAEARRGSEPQMSQMGADAGVAGNNLRKSVQSAVKKNAEGKGLSLFFTDLLDAKVREFNPRYAEAAGALLGTLQRLHSDITGNREFVEWLRNRGKFFDHEEKRERDLMLIDYEDPSRNVY
jgi:type I restriction enzyme R subunit